MSTTITPFHVNILPSVVQDFQRRLVAARLHPASDIQGLQPGGREEWTYGAAPSFMQQVQAYATSDDFSWTSIQRSLNTISQFTAHVPNTLGNLHYHKRVHYLYEEATDGSKGIPLLLIHGWPSTPFNFIDIIPLLTAQGFTVVAPTIPGYGFSEPSTEAGFGCIECSHVFQSLMVEVLGFHSFVVQGGDWGSIIGRMMAIDHPEHVLAYHTNMAIPLPPTPTQWWGDGFRYLSSLSWMAMTTMFSSYLLSPAEQEGLKKTREYPTYENGYFMIQSTKPQTLGYGLNDSPLGLLAWVGEKEYAWSDHDGQMQLPMDKLLATCMVYWSTHCITSSMRFYYETAKLTPHAQRLQAARLIKAKNTKNTKNEKNEKSGTAVKMGGDLRHSDFVSVPTGVLVAHDIFQSPRSWIEYSHNVVQYTDIRRQQRGGHFLKMENPTAVVEDLVKFVFETLGATKKNGVEKLEERRRLAVEREKVSEYYRYLAYYCCFFVVVRCLLLLE